jgi:hypothetical protein
MSNNGESSAAGEEVVLAENSQESNENRNTER